MDKELEKSVLQLLRDLRDWWKHCRGCFHPDAAHDMANLMQRIDGVLAKYEKDDGAGGT